MAAKLASLLSGVASHCQEVLGRCGLEAFTPQELQNLRNAVALGARLTTELEAMADLHSQGNPTLLLDLNDLIATHARALRSLVGDRVHFTTLLGLQLPAVRARSSEVLQILFNLAASARDAMPSGGELLFATNCELPPADSRDKAAGRRTNDMTAPTCVAGYRREVSPSLPAASAPLSEDNALVTLRIQDTSRATADQLQCRLHKPFFAARPNGIGLTSVAEVGKDLGAMISVDGSNSQQTTVTIYLPGTHTNPFGQHAPNPVFRQTGR